MHYELQKLTLVDADCRLKILFSNETQKFAETIFKDTKYEGCLTNYDDFIGCECPIVVLFFKKTEDHWQLLEMASRAQLKV